ADQEREAEGNFGQRDQPAERRNPGRGKLWIQRAGVREEVIEVAPRDVLRTRRPPQPEAIRHAREEPRGERETEVDRVAFREPGEESSHAVPPSCSSKRCSSTSVPHCTPWRRSTSVNPVAPS